jgi:hypothetical protein
MNKDEFDAALARGDERVVSVHERVMALRAYMRAVIESGRGDEPVIMSTAEMADILGLSVADTMEIMRAAGAPGFS